MNNESQIRKIQIIVGGPNFICISAFFLLIYPSIFCISEEWFIAVPIFAPAGVGSLVASGIMIYLSKKYAKDKKGNSLSGSKLSVNSQVQIPDETLKKVFKFGVIMFNAMIIIAGAAAGTGLAMYSSSYESWKHALFLLLFIALTAAGYVGFFKARKAVMTHTEVHNDSH